VVEVTGVAITDDPVVEDKPADGDQRYVNPPLAVSVAAPPAHNTLAEAVAVKVNRVVVAFPVRNVVVLYLLVEAIPLNSIMAK
jgi:hypothetical protein